MTRPPRLHVPGGCYHVVLRGNHRESLFSSAADRRVLNQIVADVIGRCGTRIHAFCWMTNHLHALLQISDLPLGNVVQRFAQRFSRYRHKQLHTAGHLFERRHQAKLVDVDAYFLTLLRYIHLNPVNAHIVADPSRYPWSSHRAYVGSEAISWLTTEFGLSLFSQQLHRARAEYKRFMGMPPADDVTSLAEASHPDDSRILGTDQFIARIRGVPEGPRDPTTLQQLAEKICGEYFTTVEMLRSPSKIRSISRARVVLARRALTARVATSSEVARFLRRNPSSITRLLERHGCVDR